MTHRARIGAIFRVTSGNFFEQFDFFLFGFYATYIAHTFFPASSEFASLMMTFAVFGAGFLMRPIGAVVLGAYIDKVGRRKGLIVTLSIMAAGTFMIVLIPSYQSIGLWAPLLVLIGRLLQGFSAGAELGGVSVYLAEIATPGRKGFYTSWQSGSRAVGQSAGRDYGGGRDGLYPQRRTGRERYPRMGLAYSVPVWLPDCAVYLCAASQAGRDAGVQQSPQSS